MSVEDGGDRDNYIQSRETSFNEGYKLDPAATVNYRQDFLSAYSLGNSEPELAEDMVGRIPHYLERAQKECQGKPGAYELIERRSDHEAVAALDQLIDEFKADFPHIVQERDEAAVRKFTERIRQLEK